jgi:uncharacterized protein YciI
MQFIILGHDGDDSDAQGRRNSFRAAHLKLAKEIYDRGQLLYAAAILDDEGQMTGSMMVCDFPSRRALEEQWLKVEPYILGGVWKRYEVHRAQTPSFLDPVKKPA